MDLGTLANNFSEKFLAKDFPKGFSQRTFHQRAFIGGAILEKEKFREKVVVRKDDRRGTEKQFRNEHKGI